MAKTPKLKKSNKSTSLHSRAARRSAAAEPITKSLLSLPSPGSPPTSSSSRLPSTRPGSGVSKTRHKRKIESRQQRLRRERGLEKAEVVVGKRERKVERSLGKEIVGRDRGVTWDELNGKIWGKKRAGAGTGAEKREREGLKAGDSEEDGGMDEDHDGDMGVSQQLEVKVQTGDDGESSAAGAPTKAIEVTVGVEIGKRTGDGRGEGEGEEEEEDQVL